MRYINTTIMVLLAVLCSAEVFTEPQQTALVAAIQELQPYKHVVSDKRAVRLAGLFADAGEENELDPKLLIAITMRESSFVLAFEKLESFGRSRGEIGLMQCHGAALKFRPFECSSNLEGAYCQIQTGARYLAYSKRTCSGSRWRWVAAYGLGRCPSEVEAKRTRGARNAERYHTRIGGVGWDVIESL